MLSPVSVCFSCFKSYVISYHLLKLCTSKFQLCNCLNLVIFLHNTLFVLFKWTYLNCIFFQIFLWYIACYPLASERQKNKCTLQKCKNFVTTIVSFMKQFLYVLLSWDWNLKIFCCRCLERSKNTEEKQEESPQRSMKWKYEWRNETTW